MVDKSHGQATYIVIKNVNILNRDAWLLLLERSIKFNWTLPYREQLLYFIWYVNGFDFFDNVRMKPLNDLPNEIYDFFSKQVFRSFWNFDFS